MTFEAYPWSPVYAVTPDVILDLWGEDDHTALFEPGYEITSLNILWSCSWAMTWLNSRNGIDPSLEAQALEYIVNSFDDMVDDDYSRIPLREMADKAQIGDPEGVINFVNLNCTRLNLERFENT